MLIRLEVGLIETNCYIYCDDTTCEGIIIDPGGDSVEILDTVKSNKVKVKYIVLTHGHWDHIGAVDRVKVHTKAQIMIHNLDAKCLQDSTESLGYMFGINNPPVTPDILLNGGEEIKIGDIVLKVVHTPGHTQGSICLLGNGLVFTGDTLFRGAIGRTDLPGGDYNTLVGSIKSQLFVLPDETVVYPGHGSETTIGEEKNGFEKKW